MPDTPLPMTTAHVEVGEPLAEWEEHELTLGDKLRVQILAALH